jgi:hypothetical protein
VAIEPWASALACAWPKGPSLLATATFGVIRVLAAAFHLFRKMPRARPTPSIATMSIAVAFRVVAQRQADLSDTWLAAGIE